MHYTPDLQLDIYTPGTSNGRSPVAVLLHGCCGDRGDVVKLAESVSSLGAVVFNVDWGGMGARGRYPASFDAVAHAVRFASHHAEHYGGDPHRVVLAGWSDGAMAAATVALGPPRPTPPGCPELVGSARAAALVGIAGFYGWELPVDSRYDTPRAQRFFGGSPSSAATAWRLASPYNWIDNEPRVLITLVVGEDDPLRVDTELFALAMTGAGGAPRVVRLPPAGEPSLLSPRTSEGRTTAAEIVRVLT